jgi:hypothetical protein
VHNGRAPTRNASEGIARPTVFKPEYNKRAAALSSFGTIDKDLADAVDVSKVTINAWKKAHPEFLKE